MPKQSASPHFDVRALLAAVQQQDIGLRVSTNDVEGFRRIVGQYIRAQPTLRCRIYRCPRSASALLLLKLSATVPALSELPDASEEAPSEEPGHAQAD